MNWTREQYETLLRDRAVKRAGSRSIVQEQKNAFPGETHYEPGKAAMDGEGDQFYRVTVTLLVSDLQDRDADGAISTILDCINAAVGRLLGLDRSALRKLATSEKRRRRCNRKN